MKNKFKVGDVVLYQNGDSFELGIVKRVVEESVEQKVYEHMCSCCPRARHCHEECETCEEFDVALEESELEPTYSYYVYYHMGDTTARTDESLLHKIENSYAFNVIRKSANNKDINLCPARQLASRILGQLELYGDMYYKLEDWLTDFLEGTEHDLPEGIESEYLKCALRVEVRDYFDDNNAIDVEPEDIENVINELFKSFSQNVLNTDFIYDTVRDYIDKNNIKCESEEE